MLKNYLKVAVRSLLKNKTFSTINIFGLALSMSVCVGIISLGVYSKDPVNFTIVAIIAGLISIMTTTHTDMLSASPKILIVEKVLFL
ncbi:MAG: hypothetical protein AAFX57_14375, partial [Bacteroidota bacterium]